MAERDDYAFPALAEHWANPDTLLDLDEHAAYGRLGPAIFYEWAQAGWRAGHEEELPE